MSTNGRYNLVFSCSGAADVGAIADQSARSLSREKNASMCCASAVAAEIPEIIELTRNAHRILAIDGCSKNCTKIILEKAEFSNFDHLQLETLGMIKKESPLTDERITSVVKQVYKMLHN